MREAPELALSLFQTSYPHPFHLAFVVHLVLTIAIFSLPLSHPLSSVLYPVISSLKTYPSETKLIRNFAKMNTCAVYCVSSKGSVHIIALSNFHFKET